MNKLMSKIMKKKDGFTLIEMLIVLVVVGLLMAIIIPNVAGQKTRIEAKAKENIAEIITTQVNTYHLVEGNEANPTIETLLKEGFITDKQAKEATSLLGFEANATIVLPIETE